MIRYKVSELKLIVLLLLPVSMFGQNFKFNYYEIGRFGRSMGQTSLIDMDKDGDLDWVFGQRGKMYWFEYLSGDEWKLKKIGEGASTDVGGCPYDVNADGWIDFIVGDSWYENPGNPHQEFILHKKNMINSHDNIVCDIDGDGIKDVVSMSNHKDHPVLCWYKVPEDINTNWNYTKIGAGIHGGIAPYGYADLDNDNDIDIIRGNAWFENLDGKGIKWEMHETLLPNGGNRPDKYGLAIKTWCYDLDNDGDMDIIEAEADTKNGRVFWFENVNNATDFKYHQISADSTGQDFHSLAIADFDLDGDMDVCSGGGPLSEGERELIIWNNLDGNARSWEKRVILKGKRIHELVAADVDGDGDFDICTKPWRGDLHIYLENQLIHLK